MTLSHSSARHLDPHLWGRFIKVLQDQGINQRYFRWYALRVEQYLKAHSGQPPHQHTEGEVTTYLQEIGRTSQLKDWQYRQLVQALEVLFVKVLELPWAQGFDWPYWKDSARELEPSHATVARDVFPDPTTPRQVAASTGVLDQIRKGHDQVIQSLIAEIRRRAYSIRTEQAYEQWVCRFIAFFDNCDPHQLGAAEVKSFLEHLAVNGNVAASTQNQALNALVFLYRHVLDQPLGMLDSFARAKRPRRLPVVLTRGEVRALLAQLKGTQWLMASLLYGTGMRLMECVRLRTQDIDFEYRQIVVRNVLLTDAERQGLEKRIHRYSTPQQVARRARLILLAAEGKNHVELAKQMNVSLEMAPRLGRLKIKPSQFNAWLI